VLRAGLARKLLGIKFRLFSTYKWSCDLAKQDIYGGNLQFTMADEEFSGFW